MKTILSFGYHHYLLKDGVNVSTLLKALGESDLLKRLDYSEKCNYQIEEKASVSIFMIEENRILSPKKPKRIPEKASPDCNGPALPLN